jgi:hypothetical protein
MKINRSTSHLYKKASRIQALGLMERVDVWRQHIDFAVDSLGSVTGLQGDALAHYCKDQGYSQISRLIFDPQTKAFCGAFSQNREGGDF